MANGISLLDRVRPFFAAGSGKRRQQPTAVSQRNIVVVDSSFHLPDRVLMHVGGFAFEAE